MRLQKEQLKIFTEQVEKLYSHLRAHVESIQAVLMRKNLENELKIREKLAKK